MRAALLRQPQTALELTEVATPVAGAGEIVVEVAACGVCRTDVHVADGELLSPKLPLIPGHQIVGHVVSAGAGTKIPPGTRVGIPWLAWTCGECRYCRQKQENLCDNALFTGYTADGGFAEFVRAKADFCFTLPDNYSDVEAAPLLCAGLIGYRAWRKIGTAQNVGLYGFGSAAHLICQIGKYQGRNIAAFTRRDDIEAQGLAQELGANWAGASDQLPPFTLDAAIIFAPVGELVPQALKAVGKGGVVVCAGIHMSDIPAFPYADLWEERRLVSVANLTREDGSDFLTLAAEYRLQVAVQTIPLAEINSGLEQLRRGTVRGSLVISFSE